jgi:DNA-binding protein H-NS
MTKDLSGMTYAELVELTRQAEAMMKEQRAEALDAVVAQIKELAESHKLSLEDIISKLGGSKSSGPKSAQTSSVKPQFAHPENPSLTWSGRGRTPAWVLEYVGTDKLDRLSTEHQAKLDEIRV